MKIERLEYIPTAIDRSQVFKIASGSALTTENVMVKVYGEDKVGWGNASANDVTEETTESMIKALEAMKKDIEGKDIDIEEFWTRQRERLPDGRAALAGLDIALYDLKAKLEGKRVFELFDGREKGIVTDRTIGIMSRSETVERAHEFMNQGFKALKVKIGLDLFEDIRRLKAIRDEVSPTLDMWVDANQGYRVQEALTLCQKLEELDIEFIEQPITVGDEEGMRTVTSRSQIPIMADESVKDPEDAERICYREMADLINIKLMKCGGITGGRKIVEVLEEYGVNAMVGCMGEVVPSLAAAVHLHMSTGNIRYADLDSHFMLSDNITSGFDFKDGRLWTQDQPGLGIDVLEEKVDKYRMEFDAE
ncbi:MAG: mandelate racemase/muconate lactonizing enzyme family protein [Candidatus Saliniplasma sp.]